LADYRASRPRKDGRVPHVRRWTARGWNAARQTREPFADLTNDGDEEGALFIDRLPLRDEAEPHPPLSQDRQKAGVERGARSELARLRANAFKHGFEAQKDARTSPEEKAPKEPAEAKNDADATASSHSPRDQPIKHRTFLAGAASRAGLTRPG
jgi:hypothetical protein